MAKTKVSTKETRKKISKFKREVSKQGSKLLKEVYLKEISKGNSPVSTDGSGRIEKFAKYSDSYKDAIKAGRYKKYGKKIKPVNLKLSGKMIRSLRFRATVDGIRITWNNFLADIHNSLGAGKSKTIRRLLPDQDGEVFNNNITRPFNRLIRAIKKQVFK